MILIIIVNVHAVNYLSIGVQAQPNDNITATQFSAGHACKCTMLKCRAKVVASSIIVIV